MVGLIVAGYLFHTFNYLLAESMGARRLHDVFAAQNQMLRDPPVRLGITTSTDPLLTQCYEISRRVFLTTYGCEYFLALPGSTRTMNQQQLQTYQEQSPKLLALLAQNGWAYDNQTEYDNSADHLMDVAYFKNMEAISCNFKVGKISSTVTQSTTLSTNDSIGVYYYACRTRIDVPNPNIFWRTVRYRGT